MSVLVFLVTLAFPVEYIDRGDAYLEQGRYADAAIADYEQVVFTAAPSLSFLLSYSLRFL